MGQIGRLPLSVLDSYPRPDREAVHKLYQKEWEGFGRKVVVLDDDPTGVQTVSGIHVYTDWDRESLAEGMQEEKNMFFVLTNSRSFSVQKTVEEHRLLARRTVEAARQTGKEFLFVARGDSTLRGHYLLEPQVLRENLEEETGRRIDGLVICPFFREGGRFTIDSVHYVKEGEELVPAGQTEFAADKTFGYRSSHLGDYLEEKSGGTYAWERCIYITLSLLRAGAYEEITRMLLAAKDFCPICVDAICESDVEAFAICLLRAMKTGKEFVIRSAAAVPKVLGNVPDRPLLSREELLGEAGAGETSGGTQLETNDGALICGGKEPGAGHCGTAAEGGQEPVGQHPGMPAYGGLVLVGSHVKKTTAQLKSLLQAQVPMASVEFRVSTCFTSGGLEEETRRVIREAEKIMAQGKTAVVYTSRTLLAPEGMDRDELLGLSVRISDAVTSVVAGLTRQPRFLIAKGGITSSDVGTRALRVKKALVLGQAAPGIPVWRTGPESKFPGLSYIIFPGNVGDVDTLRKIVEGLA